MGIVHAPSLELGAPAPSFVLSAAASGAPVFSLAALRGAPVVLAFAGLHGPSGRGGEPAVTENEGPVLARIRAQLRGLGASLVLLSERGVWSFRPDDDIDRVAEATPLLTEEVRRAARLFGALPEADGPPLVSVFILDSDGRLRFSRLLPDAQPAGMGGAVADALVAAGEALVARPQSAVTLSRREWVVASLVAGFALAFLDGCRPRNVPVGTTSGSAPRSTDEELDVVLRVNGVDRTVRIDPRVTLLDALRERLALTGSKKGCDHGQCGACTVLVDGRRVLGCLTLAVAARGAEVETIEGLAKGDDLHPVQAAFLAKDGLQCGYCTPGQIMSAVALLREGRAKTDDEVREAMSGNLCRCGAYPNIVAAIQLGRKGA